MHVASTAIFEGPTPTYEEFRDHLDSRLHLVPRFRQKLRFVPYGQGRPVWVDDPQLNLDYHVRHTALPAPGSNEQLRNLAARIFSQRLDRSKPVWEMWLVDGLKDGRFAVIGKSHHALVDGVSGVDISTVLYDLAPDPAPLPPADPWIPQPEPTEAQLVADALLERATSPAEMVRGVRALVRRPRQVLGAVAEGVQATGAFARAGFSAPASPFNVKIGPYRRFAMVRADLAELKRIKDEAGGTVNDVVLAAVAGALGRFMRARGHSTHELELRAMVPISVRTADERGDLGNRVSAMMATLPVWCEDPIERLHVVTESMGDLKSSKQAMGATMLTNLSDFAPPTIVGQAARLQSRQRMFNMVVTNVPVPQFPLYLLGRELLHIFPMVPLAANQGVCFGLMSYNGSIDFGLIGDYDTMPDLDDLAADLEASIAELSEATGRPAPKPALGHARANGARAKA
jgi:diacylglycerol O-acyltransferase